MISGLLFLMTDHTRKEKYYVIGVTLDGCDGSGNSYTSKDDVTSDTVTETSTNQPLAAIPAALQKHMHIWYGKDAMKMFFYKGLRKAYPQAHYRDMSKYGHAMYCIMDPKGYVKDIEKIIS